MSSRLTSAVRRRLTYANVVATLALFMAMGGTAAAAVLITSNSQVAQNTIAGHAPPTGKHANIIGGSVNGTDISPTLKASLTVHCPTGMQLGGSVCFTTAPTNPVDYQTAMATCANANARLPSPGELTMIFDHTGAPQPGHWTSAFLIESGFDALGMGETSGRAFTYIQSNATSLMNYRCVTTPTN